MKFLAAFLLIPLLEVAVFIQVGDSIGVFWTILLTIGTALLGATLVRIQGMATLFNARQQLMQGQLPAGAVIEGAILLVCGAMLLTPGFVTDTLGFLGLVPTVRHYVASAVVKQVAMRSQQRSGFHEGHSDADNRPSGKGPKTIDGQWTRED